MFLFLTTRWHCVIFFFFLILPPEATFFILSWIWYSMSSGPQYHQDKTEGVLFPPFLVGRNPLFPSSPAQIQQVLDAVPARAWSVWFTLLFSQSLKPCVQFYFFSLDGEMDKMNRLPRSKAEK